MGSTSTAPGSGTVSTSTGGLIVAGGAIAVLATGKLLRYVLYGTGQTSTAANPGAQITVTATHPGVQVQNNEIVPSASSGRTDGPATDVVAFVPAPANNEVQVQIVVETPPFRSGHPTAAQNAMADVFTTTYRMMLDYIFSAFTSGTA
ncbi:unnamed protein product [Sphagnum jensenii]|uniref:Uncharacterized protein n=1 Tax=Sphagnum jensenii TaxID=128206 RepID=A0ABP1B1Y7_9BRYO